MNCLVTALRVLVNVTNTSPFWCEGVLQSQPVITTILRLIHTSNLPTPDSPRLLASLLSSPSKVFPSSSPLPPIPGVSDLSGEVDEPAALTAATEALKVDVLCLSLGLLNNLVEGVEAARDRVRRTGEFVANPSASRRELDLTSRVLFPPLNRALEDVQRIEDVRSAVSLLRSSFGTAPPRRFLHQAGRRNFY